MCAWPSFEYFTGTDVIQLGLLTVSCHDVLLRAGCGIRAAIGTQAPLMWRLPQDPSSLLETTISRQTYLAEATLPSEPLISNFSLVPSSLTTSILYCS